MKARDIIPGWPRPRTSVMWRGWQYPYWWMRTSDPFLVLEVCMVLDENGNVVHDMGKRREYIERARSEMKEALAEFAANRAYHESQQRMVDEFRTGLVATRFARNYIGIELNPAYVEMSEKRIRQDATLFNLSETTA